MNKTVLVVDDEPSIRELLAMALAEEGFAVVTAADGQQALDILEKQNIQVMILDMKMPGLTGLELGRRIRSKSPLASMIALTGYRSLFQLAECREAGFDDYFTKPVKLDELRQALLAAFTKLERWRQY